MSITLSGDDDFIKNMQKKAKNLEHSKPRILKAGAEPIRKAMSDKAPRSEKSGDHMADHIIISEMKSDGKEEHVDVGPEARFFYAKFQEFGTVNQKAQPFAEPAFLEKRRESLQSMAEETRRVIESV